MIEAALQLMVLGMAVVFVFLIILVALMTVMSAITRRFEPSVGTVPGDASASPVPSAAAGTSPDQQIAAVLAAVAQHHHRRGGTAGHTTHTSGVHT
ncbi:MAG: OadG family protein [Alkalispirochaeta sp.]